jgi:predicted dehydrogenase
VPPTQKHPVLVVGCGSIGERHLRCFIATRRAEVAACERNGDLLSRVTKQYRVEGTSDWEEALSSNRYSAVVICTPAPLHVPIARRALELGLHALIEKPLSHSLAGVDELLAAEKQSPGRASVAYVLHVQPWMIAAREFIASGEIGPVLQVTVQSGQPFHRLRPGYADSYYRDRRSGGGAVQDALTHSVNWVESVVGPTTSVLSDCAHLALPGVDVEDTVHVAARNGDVLVNYALNQFQVPNESFLQFNAARASVRIEPRLHRWGVIREGEGEWTWHGSAGPAPTRDTPFEAQANAFLDQIEGKPSRLCTVDAAAQTLRFNLAALQSAEAGQRVFCDDVRN